MVLYQVLHTTLNFKLIMKNIKYLLILVTVIFFASCEEVIDVDLDTATPRLVVEASIDWERGAEGNQQTVKLSTTTGLHHCKN